MSITLVSWNVNGIRAAINKGFWDKINGFGADAIGIQETKSDSTIMASESINHPNYNLVFHSGTLKKGYSGVATLTRTNSAVREVESASDLFIQAEQPILGRQDIHSGQAQLTILKTMVGLGIEKFDIEGRLVSNLYEVKGSGFQFWLINGYFPQGGRGPERIAYKIEFYRAVYDFAQEFINKGQHVLICGDLNTTVGDIDLARPKENRNTTGCLPEEREALNWFLQGGYVDTFRHFYPDLTGKYSYWDQITRARERNVGWRIDYFLASQSIMPYIKDAFIWDQIMGSDHCPVGINLELV